MNKSKLQNDIFNVRTSISMLTSEAMLLGVARYLSDESLQKMWEVINELQEELAMMELDNSL